MTRGKRTAAWIAVGGILAVLLGLRVFGNVLDVPGDGRGRSGLTAEQRDLERQIEELRGDNGLFTASPGSAARPGLHASAHGLSALRTATGRQVAIRAEREALRAEFAAEVLRDPFSAAVSISRLESATGAVLHTPDDVDVLLSHFAAQARFGAGKTVPGDVSVLLDETSGALVALDHFGVRLGDDRRAAVRSWLAEAEETAPPRPVQLYHLAYIAAAVGAQPPAHLAARAGAWWQERGHALSVPGDESDAIEAAYYVLLADRLDLKLTANQERRLRGVLEPRGSVRDPQVQSLSARAWLLLGSPRTGLAPLVEEIRSRQLPTGLMPAVQVRHGALTSTYEVVALRLIAGLPLEDPLLREGLADMRTTVLTTYDPLLRGAWLTLMEAVGGTVGEQDTRDVLAAVRASAPRSVDDGNVDVWSRYTEVLAGLDQDTPAVRVTRWPADSPERRYGRSLLINGLARADRLDALPGERPAPAELVGEAEERLRAGTVREAAEALGAAHALGWTPRTADAERIGELLEARRDCPGASAFYRDSARDTECGVPGTRAAYRITALLEGALPAEAAR
ncbi:hypothetical protein [Streptomyces sp. NPDC048001]|uniref:hypothetical protein n=1 Tax=Streptomyces sp. NPDC048001 TaxID=3365498 RepID=UPI00371626AC